MLVKIASQSQKTQGFCVADFATLSDETRSRSTIFPLFIWIKEPCVRKFEGLERSKLLGISQTKVWPRLYISKHVASALIGHFFSQKFFKSGASALTYQNEIEVYYSRLPTKSTNRCNYFAVKTLGLLKPVSWMFMRFLLLPKT